MKKDLKGKTWNLLARTGSTKTSSTSKITKTTANTKNRRENAWRVSPTVVNPHSSGAINSRERLINLEVITPRAKKTAPNSKANNIIILHNQIYYFKDESPTESNPFWVILMSDYSSKSWETSWGKQKIEAFEWCSWLIL